MDSAKELRRTFFYVKNAPAPEGEPEVDRIGLSPFTNMTPDEKPNWGDKPKKPSKEIGDMLARLTVLVNEQGLHPADLVATFVSRRVLPLQSRPHKICHMSGRFDPCRFSTHELSKKTVAMRVADITKLRPAHNWDWGLEAHSREDRPPNVSFAAAGRGSLADISLLSYFCVKPVLLCPRSYFPGK